MKWAGGAMGNQPVQNGSWSAVNRRAGTHAGQAGTHQGGQARMHAGQAGERAGGPAGRQGSGLANAGM